MRALTFTNALFVALLGATVPASAFEVSANVKATIVTDLGTNAYAYCYLYVLGKEKTKPEREDYSSVLATINGSTLTCAPKVNFGLAEIPSGTALNGLKVQYKVVISGWGSKASGSITPYYSLPMEISFLEPYVIDLTNKNIKF